MAHHDPVTVSRRLAPGRLHEARAVLAARAARVDAAPIAALAALALLLAAGLAGCGKDGAGDSASPGGQAGAGQPASPGDRGSPRDPAAAPAPADSPQAAIAAKAAQYYRLNCRGCHGDTGRGDGPMAATFNPPARDYSDPAWQASITDQEIKDILIQGGAALGKSGLMQPRPDLARKPELLDALVALIRGFARK